MQEKKYNKLSELGIILTDEKTCVLRDFQNIFLDFNKYTNLISKNDEQFFFEKHLFDSLSINLFFQKYKLEEKKILWDIGTGGGFPALPISLLYKDIDVFAVDSIGKKIEIISQIKEKLSIENLTPIKSRIEEIDKNMLYNANIVTSRALAQLNVLVEYAMPLLKVGGFLIASKSKNSDNEIENAKHAFKILGCELIDKISYNLPLEENYERNLIIIKKIKPTPKGYPRSTGMAKKSPL